MNWILKSFFIKRTYSFLPYSHTVNNDPGILIKTHETSSLDVLVKKNQTEYEGKKYYSLKSEFIQ